MFPPKSLDWRRAAVLAGAMLIFTRWLRFAFFLAVLALGPHVAPSPAPLATAVPAGETNSADPASRAEALFSLEGAPADGKLRATVLDTALRARLRLGQRWPRPLSEAPLRMVWIETPEDLERLTGRRDGNVLALADKRGDVVYLNGPRLRQAGADQLEPTLVHEMVHIAFARAGVDRLPRWLEEGLAMRLAGERLRGGEFLLAADRLLGRVEDSAALWHPWPPSQSFESRAYRQATSMTSFLLERYFRGSENRLLVLLLRPDEGDAFLERLWRPDARVAFYQAWRNQTGRLAPLFAFLSDSTVVLGGFGGILMVLAWMRRRQQARAIQESWKSDGPWFSRSALEEEEEGEGEGEGDEDGDGEDWEWVDEDD